MGDNFYPDSVIIKIAFNNVKQGRFKKKFKNG